eukprot:260715-Prorocentrum_minimum.AAC.1
MRLQPRPQLFEAGGACDLPVVFRPRPSRRSPPDTAARECRRHARRQADSRYAAYVLTADQLDAGSAGVFSRRTS